MFLNFDLFLESLAGKKIAFIGTGISNLSTINLMLKSSKKPLNITLLDLKSEKNLNERVLSLKQNGVKFICGENYLKSLTEFDLVVRSPGVYFNKPEMRNAISHGVVVTSEMELFFDFCPCKIIGITGSDGKTTTTTIISKILEEQGYNVHLGGNIGKPLIEKIKKIKPNDIAVVELSSFQLISMRKSPQIAVITNISPNHLDVHKDMEEYVNSKLNILLHQGAFDTLILNSDDQFCSHLEKNSRSFIKKFSTVSKTTNGSFYNEVDKTIYYSKNSEITKVLDAEKIKIVGVHNIKNYLAAIAAVFEMVSIEAIEKTAENFGGVKHRLEFVTKKHGVCWLNDSIATTPTRTIAGLECFNKKIILIAGGYDKKISFNELASKIVEKVKIIILMGSTKNKIEDAIKNCANFDKTKLKIKNVENMEQAVKVAAQNAKDGDFVVLSPACASFDLYENFEQRGNHFKNIVNEESI